MEDFFDIEENRKFGDNDACAAAVLGRSPSRGEPSMYCWTADIADQHKKCHKLYRLAQDLHARGEACAAKAEYKKNCRGLIPKEVQVQSRDIHAGCCYGGRRRVSSRHTSADSTPHHV